METSIKGFNNYNNQIEQKVLEFEACQSQETKDRIDQEIQKMFQIFEGDICNFQLRSNGRFQSEITTFEMNIEEFKIRIQKSKKLETAYNESQNDNDKHHQTHNQETQQQLIEQGSSKLKDGLKSVMNMLKMAEAMKEEVNLIDDEVMIQKEKLIKIKEELKQVNNMSLQTKKMLFVFAKLIKKDCFLMTLITLVSIMLLSIFVCSVMMAVKQKQADVRKQDNASKNAITDEVDFQNYKNEIKQLASEDDIKKFEEFRTSEPELFANDPSKIPQNLHLKFAKWFEMTKNNRKTEKDEQSNADFEHWELHPKEAKRIYLEKMNPMENIKSDESKVLQVDSGKVQNAIEMKRKEAKNEKPSNSKKKLKEAILPTNANNLANNGETNTEKNKVKFAEEVKNLKLNPELNKKIDAVLGKPAVDGKNKNNKKKIFRSKSFVAKDTKAPFDDFDDE